MEIPQEDRTIYFALFVFVIRRCINVVVMATEVYIFCDMPIYTVTTLSKDESIDYHMSVLSSCGIKIYNFSYADVNPCITPTRSAWS
jgi:hypothetical protein